MTAAATRVAILGATGSIGTQALAVIRDLRRAGRAVEVAALAAGRNVDGVAAVAREFAVPRVAVAAPREADLVRKLLPRETEVVHGADGLAYLASHPDVDLVLNAVVGAVGLAPTLAALEAGKTVALANKESLVIGGELVLGARRRPDQILPVDSEHAALFQLLTGVDGRHVDRAWITASGGPFRDRSAAELCRVTPAEALAHPVWSMGRRISVDSATLANKAFEVIEAHHLFALSWSKIGVLIHPQACVHALVELVDGTVLAQVAYPDMRIPIQAALTHPDRLPRPAPRLPLAGMNLVLEELAPQRYPAFRAVVEAGERGGTAPAVANAADEVLVEAFLSGKIAFTDIAEGIAAVVAAHAPNPAVDVQTVLSADNWARVRAEEFVARRGRSV
ncbi:MAG: 1-deoxy-D-xylulose 5-phosphate reductoisomerase [Candidatus Bipolaricaulis sibiricus]|uniref:1-deoxy-D-xylulose 5-phosphate reductoisomerase n=1 Tax=Bipolaricaulis sibiricus TaxID=2501609 RepID=A0A410FVA9_BIPS1|nr:MAG: 1-deoxy-D-xylulose 5-phosphate reductoisomerase [Candidatus Bipolaricaulis sibiricus]